MSSHYTLLYDSAAMEQLWELDKEEIANFELLWVHFFFEGLGVELSEQEKELNKEELVNLAASRLPTSRPRKISGFLQRIYEMVMKRKDDDEMQLHNEQDTDAAFQEKLKSLRWELYTEKKQNSEWAGMDTLEMVQMVKKMVMLEWEACDVADERAARLAQMQKMTQIQQGNAVDAQEDNQQQAVQLQEANETIQRELETYKNTVQVSKVDTRNLENELDSARDQMLQWQKAFEESEQMTKDMQALSDQVNKLNAQVIDCEKALADNKEMIERYEAEKRSNGAEENLFQQLTDRKQLMARKETNYEEKAVLDKYEAEQEHGRVNEESLQRQPEEWTQKNKDLEAKCFDKTAIDQQSEQGEPDLADPALVNVDEEERRANKNVKQQKMAKNDDQKPSRNELVDDEAAEKKDKKAEMGCVTAKNDNQKPSRNEWVDDQAAVKKDEKAGLRCLMVESNAGMPAWAYRIGIRNSVTGCVVQQDASYATMVWFEVLHGKGLP